MKGEVSNEIEESIKSFVFTAGGASGAQSTAVGALRAAAAAAVIVVVQQ